MVQQSSARIHTRIHTHTYTHMYTHMYTHTHTYLHTYAHTHARVRIYSHQEEAKLCVWCSVLDADMNIGTDVDTFTFRRCDCGVRPNVVLMMWCSGRLLLRLILLTCRNTEIQTHRQMNTSGYVVTLHSSSPQSGRMSRDLTITCIKYVIIYSVTRAYAWWR